MATQRRLDANGNLIDDGQIGQDTNPNVQTPQGGAPDRNAIEERLRKEAAARGVTYDPSDTDGILRNASYTAGSTNGATGVDDGINQAVARYDQRKSNTPAPTGSGLTAPAPGTLQAPPAYHYDIKQPQVDPYQQYNFNFSQAPQAYAPGTVAQYQAPQGGAAMGASIQSQLTQMLANPHTMNDQAVAQLKEKQKEAALQMQQDSMSGLQAGAAQRGFGFVNPALEAKLQMGTQQNLLGSYRDIDLQRMQQNRADELAAVNASDQFLTNDASRAQSNYHTQLGGQMSQEQLNQAGNTSQMALAQLLDARQGAQQQEHQFGFNSEMARQGQAFDSSLGAANFGLNSQNAANNLMLAQMQMAENQRQFNMTDNFNWENMTNSSQNALVKWLADNGYGKQNS